MSFPRGDKSRGREVVRLLREAVIPLLDMGSRCRDKSNIRAENDSLYVNLRCNEPYTFWHIFSFRPCPNEIWSIYCMVKDYKGEYCQHRKYTE
jgi:hypothetical protein